MRFDFDLFTIGAGSGGVRASRRAASLGARVAIAEDRFFGGTCVNVGCVPKKLLVYGAACGDALREATAYGWEGAADAAHRGEAGWAHLRDAVQREVSRLHGVYQHLLTGAGCHVVWGKARLLDPHTVEVATAGEVKRFTSERILIATGGIPVRPQLPGAELAWISDDVFTVARRPERLVVVGGGYIALEMASIFLGLGTKVVLVHRGAHLLRGFDDDARGFLTQELCKKGLEVRLSTTVQSLERGEGDTRVVTLARGNTLEADAVLFAIGRQPNTGGLGLRELGVKLSEQGAVEVDAGFQSSLRSIYALGDVVGMMPLTPVAIAEAEVLVARLFGSRSVTMNYDHVPTAVFTAPPLASVGLSEAQARARFSEVHIYVTEFRPLRHTVGQSSERTFMKVIVNQEDDRVVGVHLVGRDVPEMIQGFAVAIKAGATKAHFDATVGLHPTAAEELVTLREPLPEVE